MKIDEISALECTQYYVVFAKDTASHEKNNEQRPSRALRCPSIYHPKDFCAKIQNLFIVMYCSSVEKNEKFHLELDGDEVRLVSYYLYKCIIQNTKY